MLRSYHPPPLMCSSLTTRQQHEAIRHALLADPEVALVIQEFLADDANKDLGSPPRPPRKATKARTGATAATTTASDAATGVAGISDIDSSLLINPALETLRLVERATKAMRWKIDSQRVSLQQQQQQQQQQPQAPSSSSEPSTGSSSGSGSGIVIDSSPVHATISYREFHVNCIALFMPLSPKRDIYMAFNSRCPHHYLSEESLQSLIRNHEQQQQQRQQRVGSSGTTGSASARLDFIIGRVVFIEGQVATSGNAYGLAAGSKYTLLHVEEVNDKEPSQSQLQTTTSPPPPSSSSRTGMIKQGGVSTSDSNNSSDNPSSS